jgi:DNA invertase Pin-like site-specific DNA recombinase
LTTSNLTQHGKRTAAAVALDTLTVSLVARQSRGDDDSMSVEDQVAAMRDYCARQTPAWEVGGVYEERDVSGQRSLDRRPGLKAAVEDIEEGRSQVVLTAYFDRYVRSIRTRADVVERVEQAGGQVVTLDAGRDSNLTAAQFLTGNVLAMMSEYYARSVGERTAVSKKRNVERGVPPFPRITPAYVRRADGTLEPHPVNGPLVAEACRMRAGIGYDARQSYAKIARWLNAQGVRQENGDELTVTSVQSMLRSRLLIGEIHFGEWSNTAAIDQPIIDRATFRTMQGATATRGRHSKSERLLARLGVLLCETCNSRLVVHSSKSSKHGEYHYYRCPNKLCAAPASVRCDLAEELLRDTAVKLAAGFKGTATAEASTEQARLDREEAEQNYANGIRSLIGRESEPVAREVLDQLEGERDAAVAQHERLRARSKPTVAIRAAADWDRLTLDERRAVIRQTIARAVVTPGRGSDRVRVEPRDLFGQ